ncbi:MAG: hypothetical protein JXR63_03910 [Spirochaetales bacterium]|nr:hypothetical protein [Spirochaetales bacterium]
MNVIFHTLTGIALGSALTSREKPTSMTKKIVTPILGFTLGIISHGLLDVLPHTYPLKSHVDIIFSLVAFALTLLIVKKETIPLFTCCFLGSIFPDMIDLGPEMANQFFNLKLPTIKAKVFPWHLPQYSGSIYTKPSPISNLAHTLIIILSTITIFTNLTKTIRFKRRAAETDETPF